MDSTKDYYQCERLTIESFTNTVGLTDGLLCPNDQSRVCLIISAPLTNRITLAWNEAAVLDQGITLYPGAGPLVLTLKHHGELVRAQVRAITTSAPQTVRVYGSSCHICLASQLQASSPLNSTRS